MHLFIGKVNLGEANFCFINDVCRLNQFVQKKKTITLPHNEKLKFKQKFSTIYDTCSNIR